MKKKLLAIFIVFTICFLTSYASCFGGSYSVVSASSVPEAFEVPYFYDSSVTAEQYSTLKTELVSMFERCGKTASDYYVYCYKSGTSDYIYIFDKVGSFRTFVYNSDTYINYRCNRYAIVNTSIASVNSLTFYDNPSYVPYFLSYNSSNKFYTVTQISNYGNNDTFFNAPVNHTGFVFASNLLYTAPYQNDYLTGAIVGFDFSIDAFYDWLIYTGKYLELPNYIGTAKLKSFLQFYKDWGGSNQIFVDKIVSWLEYFNIVSQSVDNRNILKATIDELYREYRSQAFVTIYPHYNNYIHHRNAISTVTDDDNTILITDDVNDDTATSILRDILRGVIYIPTALFNSTELLIDKFDNLSYDVIVSNDGGATDLSILCNYDPNDFDDDFYTFETEVSSITAVPLSYVQTINNNSLMPENMLSDKQNLSVTIPVISGFTVNEDCSDFVTNTDTYTLNSTDYPWLDTVVKKMKRFASIILIIGYLIHLRFKIPAIVRGE